MGYGITVRAQGQRACFTRPELHTERASYDVITPSAARGLLEAVYWKPAIKWVIDGITILKPIAFESIRRNEVGSKLSFVSAKKAWKNGAPIYQSASDDRQQRNTLYLSDVDYIIEAHFEMTDKAGPDDTPQKHYNIALRRLRTGQWFHHPYFGTREFPADVTLVEDDDAIPESYYAGESERQLGLMLYDLDFSDPSRPAPIFFRAVMRAGRIDLREARGALLR